MTIRFTLAEKWQDKWFRKLNPAEKLLFLYMCDNCNIAGIWIVDLEQAAFSIGIAIQEAEGAYKGLTNGYEELLEDVIWVKNFLKHQRNLPLSPRNAAHATIINHLLRYKDCSNNILQLLSTDEIKGLTRGLQDPISISISKGIGKSLSKSQSISFEKFWNLYPKKTGKGKAKDSWLKLNPDTDFLVKILFAVEQQKKSEQWQKDGGQFIPLPTTWLNQSRWDDDPIVNIPKPETNQERMKRMLAEAEAKRKAGER